jgi:2-dehydro-3-deoxygalactonokinase
MYIALEWTSSAFHAWRLRTDGTVADDHRSTRGVNTVSGGAFETAMREEIAPWLADAKGIVLSGMVTSRTGWVESPFAMVPAALSDLFAQAVRKDLAGLPPLYFLPGIARHDPVPDVMRGEEMAIFGIEGAMPDCVVLPGAHTKWVRTDGSRITDVATYMSGEVLNLLKQDSLVSRLMPASHQPHPEAFERGVTMAQDKATMPGGVLQRIFSARSLVLFGRLKPEEIADYLAGVMIGSEIAEALAGIDSPGGICVLGEGAAASTYRSALATLQIASPAIISSRVAAFAAIIGRLTGR